MNLWLIVLMLISIISSLIITTKGLSFMIRSGNILLGIPIFLLGIIISAEGAIGFVDSGIITPLFWGIETVPLSIIFIWLAIIIGGRKNE